MFIYKLFFDEPKAVWGIGCVLIQEVSEEAARLFFAIEYPGYQVTRVSLTLQLPL
ncbi:hypothetical protein [Spirosoma flavum]|uniref:Uncharacterized protein n=1 Tax=Spirosoma flavum TaxID=2048557 RepID=A0ABW6ALB5_9BACT